jgi:hypothetical protein
MSIIVNHDGSFHDVTQAAIRHAFSAALEPLADGLSGPEARFKVYKETLAQFSSPSEPRAQVFISNDLSDLYPEYNFPEPGTGLSIMQYFDGMGTMLYLIKSEAG